MDTALKLTHFYAKNPQITAQKRVWVCPFEAYDPTVEKTHGKLACCLMIEYPEGLVVKVDFEELLKKYVRSYFEGEYTAIFEALRECTFGWKEELRQNLQAHGIPLDHVSIGFTAMALWGGVLYIVAFGPGRCVLKRSGELGELYVGKEKYDQEIVVLSGYVQAGDELLVKFEVDEEPVIPEITEDNAESLAALADNEGLYLVKFEEELIPSYEDERVLVAAEDEGGGFVVEETNYEADFVERMSEEHVTENEGGISRDRFTGLNIFYAKVSDLAWRIVKIFLPAVRFFTHQRLVFLGTVLLVIFFGFVFFGRDFERIWKSEEEILVKKNSIYPELQARFVDIENSKNLNPVRSQRSLKELESEIAGLPEDLRADAEVTQLYADVQRLYGELTGTYRLENLGHFFDITTVSTNGSGERLALYEKIAVVIDKGQNVVYRLDLTTKAARAIIGKEDLKADIVDATHDSNAVYALSLANIVSMPAQNSEVEEIVTRFSGWGEPKYLSLYGNQLYVLDSGRSQIWKYVPKEGNVWGEPLSYLAADGSYDFTMATDLGIDGFVWVATEDNILKFVSGRLDQYNLATAPDPLKRIKSIEVPMEHDYLYVLDHVLGAIYVYRKDTGGYVGRVIAEELREASDLGFDVTNKQIYVLKKQFIYQIDMSELLNRSF